MSRHTLPPLPYAYDALEPWIDQQTMALHHDKHHQVYLDNFVKAVAGTPFENLDVTATLAQLDTLPEGIRTVVRNHGGGYANHTLFWEIMGPNAGGAPAGPLAHAITSAFGGHDAFVENVRQEAIENVRRLRNHPSLALWAGNNENEAAWKGWGWQAKFNQPPKSVYAYLVRDAFDIWV